jgi:DNA-binding XRE family transcriptional regulator
MNERQIVGDWVQTTQLYTVGAYVTKVFPVAIEHSDAESIGKALRAERKKYPHITQQDVADVLGWSRQKVSDIERGVVEAGFLEVCRLCQYYGVTPFNLLAYGEESDRVE